MYSAPSCIVQSFVLGMDRERSFPMTIFELVYSQCYEFPEQPNPHILLVDYILLIDFSIKRHAQCWNPDVWTPQVTAQCGTLPNRLIRVHRSLYGSSKMDQSKC
uniref:Uncharacterized protein n=1 Tax=Pyxicephalus adspersus TaxID=30357 RepID=A0AAV3A959_PYXAD|nr:TPA: hypothetical protein GDO54_014580 [Pyxicephalus adspersus]